MSDIDRLQLARQPLGWRMSPADVLRLVRDDAHPVALCGRWTGSGLPAAGRGAPGPNVREGSGIVAAEPVTVRAAPGPLSPNVRRVSRVGYAG